jgi:uncharacterized metal-binding protein (TIGR02443 family)
MIKAKRFIAGAICPKCHTMDTIRLQKTHGEQMIDCINCGFSASQNLSDKGARPLNPDGDFQH